MLLGETRLQQFLCCSPQSLAIWRAYGNQICAAGLVFEAIDLLAGWQNRETRHSPEPRFAAKIF